MRIAQNPHARPPLRLRRLSRAAACFRVKEKTSSDLGGAQRARRHHWARSSGPRRYAMKLISALKRVGRRTFQLQIKVAAASVRGPRVISGQIFHVPQPRLEARARRKPALMTQLARPPPTRPLPLAQRCARNVASASQLAPPGLCARARAARTRALPAPAPPESRKLARFIYLFRRPLGP